MVESVGKKLNQARVKRGLSIDEAAHATRLRPDKIAALENDDYSRFANNIYAKGFLQIYARFLGVDVSDFARTLDNANPISVSDYQYLSNAPTPRQEATPARIEERRRPPSLAPWLFFLLIVAIGGGLLVYENVRSTAQRLERNHASDSNSSAEEPATIPATPAPSASAPVPKTPASAPRAPVTSAPPSTPPPAAAASTPAFHAPGTPSTPALAASPSLTPPVNPSKPGSTPAPIPPPIVAANTGPANRDQDFVTPTSVGPNDPNNHPASGVNEVLVAAVKTTWVTVRKDDPKAPPIFEDNVYPSANPLKLKGSRFFIEVRGDPNDVQITKNGLPFAYQGADVPVQ
jgi:cytoskeletal protein RodZ